MLHVYLAFASIRKKVRQTGSAVARITINPQSAVVMRLPLKILEPASGALRFFVYTFIRFAFNYFVQSSNEYASEFTTDWQCKRHAFKNNGHYSY